MPRYIDVVEVIYDGDRMKAVPAADVEEVKHGEWLENGADYKCSECGKYDSYGLDPYCCNCGAKMDGKESGDG